MVARSSGEIARGRQLRAPASWLAWPSGSISAMRTASALSTASITTSFSSAVCSRIERTFCSCASLETKTTRAPESLQDVGSLLGRERGIDRDRDRAQQQGSEVRNRPLRPVLAQNGNPVAATDAPVPQAARHRHDPLAKRLRRNRAPLIPQPLQHHLGMLALNHSKKHIVKSAQAHSRKKEMDL